MCARSARSARRGGSPPAAAPRRARRALQAPLAAQSWRPSARRARPARTRQNRVRKVCQRLAVLRGGPLADSLSKERLSPAVLMDARRELRVRGLLPGHVQRVRGAQGLHAVPARCGPAVCVQGGARFARAHSAPANMQPPRDDRCRCCTQAGTRKGGPAPPFVRASLPRRPSHCRGRRNMTTRSIPRYRALTLARRGVCSRGARWSMPSSQQPLHTSPVLILPSCKTSSGRQEQKRNRRFVEAHTPLP